MSAPDPDLHGWLPIRAWRARDEWTIDWCRFDRQPLREPFFQNSVDAALRHPFNQAFRRQTPIEVLLDWQTRSPGLAPTAFVFHASRCGSTLLAQMMAQQDSHIVLSEPPPLDTLLRAHYEDASIDARQVGWLRALLSALGQPRRGGERALVVKLDAWNVGELALLRRCFPATPCLFLYRDPLEMAVSHLQLPGRHTVPGLLGTSPVLISAEEAAGLTRPEIVARTLGRLLSAGLDGCRRHELTPVHYDELPHAVGGRLMPLLGLVRDDLPQALAGARQNAKRPGETFVPDGARKQSQADEATRQAVARWAEPAYEALEACRRHAVSA